MLLITVDKFEKNLFSIYLINLSILSTSSFYLIDSLVALILIGEFIHDCFERYRLTNYLFQYHYLTSLMKVDQLVTSLDFRYGNVFVIKILCILYLQFLCHKELVSTLICCQISLFFLWIVRIKHSNFWIIEMMKYTSPASSILKVERKSIPLPYSLLMMNTEHLQWFISVLQLSIWTSN
jgi:hypothetical protein